MQAEVDFQGRTKSKFFPVTRWLGNPAAYLSGTLGGAGALCCPISYCENPPHQLGLQICAIRLLSLGGWYRKHSEFDSAWSTEMQQLNVSYTWGHPNLEVRSDYSKNPGLCLCSTWGPNWICAWKPPNSQAFSKETGWEPFRMSSRAYRR